MPYLMTTGEIGVSLFKKLGQRSTTKISLSRRQVSTHSVQSTRLNLFALCTGNMHKPTNPIRAGMKLNGAQQSIKETSANT